MKGNQFFSASASGRQAAGKQLDFNLFMNHRSVFLCFLLAEPISLLLVFGFLLFVFCYPSPAASSDRARHTPLKNGVGVLEAFFHSFRVFVLCRKTDHKQWVSIDVRFPYAEFSGGAIVPKIPL